MAISEEGALARAMRYRELAQEARVEAANAQGIPRREAVYIGIAGRWEELALDADRIASAQ